MVTTNSIDCTSNPWLSRQERLLITSFRAMKDSAKHMMVDLAEDLAEALPATRPAITRQQFIADHQVRATNQQGAAS